MSELMAVHKQWAVRPDDERHLSLESIESAVAARTATAKVVLSDNKTIRLHSGEDNALVISTIAGPKLLSNWSFGQLCSSIGAPASYLRKLPAKLTEDCVNQGLTVTERAESMILFDDASEMTRSFNSPTYGRIWDLDIIHSVQKVNAGCNGLWKVPAASYSHTNPKRATTLYASDRDIFMFLCDTEHVIEVNGEQLWRGFYVYNSEVGSATFGLATFLYRMVCDNRIIWGAQDFKEVKIKHSSGAPERFLREGSPMLTEYANSSARVIEEKISRAQNIKLGKDKEEVTDFLRKFGLTASAASGVIDMAQQEEGNITSAWSIAQGITAKARGLAFTDQRVDMERLAGKLLDKVVGK
jgi:hypothetical protein